MCIPGDFSPSLVCSPLPTYHCDQFLPLTGGCRCWTTLKLHSSWCHWPTRSWNSPAWDGKFLKEWTGLCGSLCHWSQCFTSPWIFLLHFWLWSSHKRPTTHPISWLCLHEVKTAVCWFLVQASGSPLLFLLNHALWLFPKDMPRPALRSLETHQTQSPSMHLLMLRTQLHEPAQPRSHLTHPAEPSLYQLTFVWPQLRENTWFLI